MSSIDKFLRDWWRQTEQILRARYKYSLKDVNKQYLDDCFEVSLRPDQAVNYMAEFYQFHKLRGKKPPRY